MGKLPHYVFFVLLVIPGCVRNIDPSLQFDPGSVLATVNGSHIHEELFEETYINFLSRTGFADTPRQRYYHLNTIIDMFLLDEEATRRGMDDELLEDYLKRTRMRTLRNLFLKYQFQTSVELPGDPETRLAFYRTKQRPYVRQLFFNREETALMYYDRLQNGEDFVDLANELYMTSEYDSLAGFLGDISYFGVDDIFAETAFTLNAGEYSKPVRTRQGYVIIRVDNWNFNPVVTETEYLARQEKTRFFLYQRNFNIGADQFIRDYMSALTPEPQIENLRQVFLVLQQNLPASDPVVFLNPPTVRGDQIPGVDRLDPLLPLVTYTVNGELNVFRLEDYLLWIDTLPYQEVMYRFDASVGRALMWHVFATDAKKLGYDKNPFVDFNARAASRFFQAARLQSRLRQEPQTAVSEEDLKTAFELFGMNTMKSNQTTYLVVPAKDYMMARNIRDQLLENPDSWSNIAGAEMVVKDDATQRHPHLMSHLLRAVPGTPFITGAGFDWYVIQVFGRSVEYHTVDSRREEIQALIQPSYNEFILLRDLRNRAAVQIDTVAFERLMNYYPD